MMTPHVALAVGKAVFALRRPGVRVATVYLSKVLTVRATRSRFRGRLQKGPRFDVDLTIGRPNYKARAFIRQCQRAGEPFPVKRVQIER